MELQLSLLCSELRNERTIVPSIFNLRRVHAVFRFSALFKYVWRHKQTRNILKGKSNKMGYLF